MNLSVVILYHYFYPDDVISARLFSDLARHLASCGDQVTVFPCRRGCRDEAKVYPTREEWKGVSIRRVWRPSFSQSSSVGRAVNTIWMICAWALKLRCAPGRRADLVIVGTDPPCSPAVVNFFRRGAVKTKFISWVHDLYPEVAAAAGMLDSQGNAYRGISNVMSHAYSKCASVIDIGPMMKEKTGVGSETITPWSIYEPEAPLRPDSEVRKELFGDAKLGLLYSGNYGRAHDAGLFLRLAEELKNDGVALAFAVRGNCVDELTSAIEKCDGNVRLVHFEDDPAKQFAAADIHLVSLKEKWSGMVVPSKYFGALAFGRPVIYAGSEESDIGRWTTEHRTGWVLNENTCPDVVDMVRNFIGQEEKLKSIGDNCFRVYREHFSKERMLAKWDALIERCGKAALL